MYLSKYEDKKAYLIQIANGSANNFFSLLVNNLRFDLAISCVNLLVWCRGKG